MLKDTNSLDAAHLIFTLTFLYHFRWRMLPDHTLRIENVQASDAGEYVCTAENLVGSVEAVAHLRVECKFVNKYLKTPKNLLTPKIAVIILKFEQCGSAI